MLNPQRATIWGLLMFCLLSLSLFWSSCNESNDSRNFSRGVKIKLAYYPAYDTYVGVLAAKEHGFYRKYGLDVELIPMFGGEDRIRATASGIINFAFVHSPSILLAIEKRLPIKIVAMKEAQNTMATVSLKESQIKQPKNYEYHIFASDPGSIEFSMLSVLAEKNHFDVKKVSIRELDHSILLSALIDRQVDIIPAYYASNSFAYEMAAKREGKELDILLWNNFGLDIYGDALISNNDFIANNKTIVKNFVCATIEGFEYSFNHKNEIIDLIHKVDPTSDSQIVAVNWQRTVETMIDSNTSKHGLGWIDISKLERTKEVVFGNHDSRVNIKQAYTNDFLPN
jgi:NitT/TauT family transport system substrate-binding protein